MARYSIMDRTCIVCGHNLGPYGRICDKCGSIQRPTRGDGLAIPIDKPGLCERCGIQLPEDYEETVCESCAGTEVSHQVVWVEELPSYRKAKRVSIAASAASAAALGASVVLIFAVGAYAWVLVLLALSGVGLGASGASYMVFARKPSGEIQHFQGVKPESPLQQVDKQS